MQALSYLLITQLKNRILALRRKPALLILYGFVILMIVISVVMMIVSDQGMQRLHLADERIIFTAVAAFGFLYFVMFTYTGLSTGSSLFSMADVGLVFVSPISSKKILMYGLLSTMGKALLASIFILFQITNLKLNFNYGFKEIMALFIIYAILVIFGQLLSIAIYIFSNGKPFRKNLVKIVVFTIVGGLLITIIAIQRYEQLSLLEVVLRVADSNWFGYIPVAGWATMFFRSVVGGVLSGVLISLAFFIFFSILIVSLLTIGKADYYEDVLLSTEVSFQTLKAYKEGRNMPVRSTKHVKVGDEDDSILKGSGAMIFLYKHTLEMKRRSRFIYIDAYTLLVSVAVGVAGFYLKSNVTAYGILGFVIYFQFFLSVMGRLKLELAKPYIYMIPAKSVMKVFAASLTSMIKPCVDAVFIFGTLAIVGGADILTCIFCAFAYAAASVVFVAITILYQRVLGGQPNKLAQMMVGFGLLLAVMAPAIILSAVAAYLLPASLVFLCTIPFTLFCLLFTFIIFVTCGNLIDKSEFSGK